MEGVHLGQDDLSVADARRIAGTEMLIGVSTHSVEQLRRAILDGADYVGIGPTFPSQTKNFDHIPELHWRYGYQWAWFLIISTTIAPIHICLSAGGT